MPPREETALEDFAGTSPGFHISVIKNLHELFTQSGKTISYATNRLTSISGEPSYPGYDGVYETTFRTVIKAAHPYIDWISWPVKLVENTGKKYFD